jgi:hypothetical protein
MMVSTAAATTKTNIQNISSTIITLAATSPATKVPLALVPFSVFQKMYHLLNQDNFVR